MEQELHRRSPRRRRIEEVRNRGRLQPDERGQGQVGSRFATATHPLAAPITPCSAARRPGAVPGAAPARREGSAATGSGPRWRSARDGPGARRQTEILVLLDAICSSVSGIAAVVTARVRAAGSLEVGGDPSPGARVEEIERRLPRRYSTSRSPGPDRAPAARRMPAPRRRQGEDDSAPTVVGREQRSARAAVAGVAHPPQRSISRRRSRWPHSAGSRDDGIDVLRHGRRTQRPARRIWDRSPPWRSPPRARLSTRRRRARGPGWRAPRMRSGARDVEHSTKGVRDRRGPSLRERYAPATPLRGAGRGERRSTRSWPAPTTPASAHGGLPTNPAVPPARSESGAGLRPFHPSLKAGRRRREHGYEAAPRMVGRACPRIPSCIPCDLRARAPARKRQERG